MDLTEMVQELQQDDNTRRAAVFPPRFTTPTAGAAYQDQAQNVPSLFLDAYATMSVEETGALFQAILGRLGSEYRQKGVTVDCGLYWPVREFQAEQKIKKQFARSLSVVATAYTVNPEKVRIGFVEKPHHLFIERQGKSLRLTPTGIYLEQLDDFLQEVQPDKSLVQLSDPDAFCYLDFVNQRLGKITARLLAKSMQRQRITTEIFTLDGRKTEVEYAAHLNISPAAIPQISQALRKDITRPVQGDNSRVLYYTKDYSLLNACRDKMIRDMQSLAGKIGEIDLGIIFDHPILTNDAARELLEEEINLVMVSYARPEIFGSEHYDHVRSKAIRRLACEHFGSEILQGLNDLSAVEYCAMLEARGYTHAITSTGDALAAKEQYLFDFFLQSYQEDPAQSIEAFRQFYCNTTPRVDVSTRFSQKATHLTKLTFPEAAVPYSLSVNARSKQGYNTLLLTRQDPHDKLHLRVDVSVANPALLTLQNYVCSDLGINFQ